MVFDIQWILNSYVATTIVIVLQLCLIDLIALAMINIIYMFAKCYARYTVFRKAQLRWFGVNV